MKKRIPERALGAFSTIFSLVIVFMVWKETSWMLGLATFFFVVSLPLGWWWNDYKDELKPGVYGVFLAGLVSLFYFGVWYLGVAVVIALIWVSIKRLEKRF